LPGHAQQKNAMETMPPSERRCMDERSFRGPRA
jgi:hypothetical protein